MSLTVLNRNALCTEKISTFHRVWVVNSCALKTKVGLVCLTGNISLMTHIRNSVVRCSWIGLVFARRQTTSHKTIANAVAAAARRCIPLRSTRTNCVLRVWFMAENVAGSGKFNGRYISLRENRARRSDCAASAAGGGRSDGSKMRDEAVNHRTGRCLPRVGAACDASRVLRRRQIPSAPLPTKTWRVSYIHRVNGRSSCTGGRIPATQVNVEDWNVMLPLYTHACIVH